MALALVLLSGWKWWHLADTHVSKLAQLSRNGSATLMTDYKCQNGDPIRVGGVYIYEHGTRREILPCLKAGLNSVGGLSITSRDFCRYDISFLAQELPRDQDGFYIWEGGDCPVPGDWVVEVIFRGMHGVPSRAASKWVWSHSDNLGDIVGFKVISTGKSAPEWPEPEAEVPLSEAGLVFEDYHITETFHPLESDPSGIAQHAAGAKLDAGKNRLGLVLGAFSRALTCVGTVGTYGANKYTDNGWLSVERGQERYTDALYRHLMKEASGEECDPDTNIYHAAHSAWNALARLELIIREKEALERGK
jgi:hypothetical protein